MPINHNPKLQARNSYLFLRPTVSQQPNRSYITQIFSTSTSKIRFFQRIKSLKTKPNLKKNWIFHTINCYNSNSTLYKKISISGLKLDWLKRRIGIWFAAKRELRLRRYTIWWRKLERDWNLRVLWWEPKTTSFWFTKANLERSNAERERERDEFLRIRRWMGTVGRVSRQAQRDNRRGSGSPYL